MDEKAWLKGHKYFTVLADLDKRCVIDLAIDRKESSLNGIYKSLPENILKTVKAVEESGIQPMKKVSAAFQARRNQILNWYEHRISTGIVESLDAKIITIKQLARGHRNFENLKAFILFFLGGLDLRISSQPPPLRILKSQIFTLPNRTA